MEVVPCRSSSSALESVWETPLLTACLSPFLHSSRYTLHGSSTVQVFLIGIGIGVGNDEVCCGVVPHTTASNVSDYTYHGNS